MPDTRGQLLPVYIVADESQSMGPYLDDLNRGLASLHEALHSEPMIAAKVRLTILGFSDDVQVRMHLADVRRERNLPPMQIRGVTSYAAVFNDLLRRIPADIDALKRDRYAVHRPAVFFLSDGQPSDKNEKMWRAPHAQLVDRSMTSGAPNVIACGIGTARADTMLQVATSTEFAFVAVAGAQIGPSIAKFFHALTKSVVKSSNSLAAGRPQLVVERPDTFVMAIDVV